MKSSSHHRKNQSLLVCPSKKIKKSPDRQPSKRLVLKDRTKNIEYFLEKVAGNGTFGVVYKSVNPINGQEVAIKKVKQDKRFKNRELEIMKELQHENIVALHSSFFTSGKRNNEVYLNLVMDFYNENLCDIIEKQYFLNKRIPLLMTKVYSYQLIRSLLYCSLTKVCHRDVKPQNLLINPRTHKLVLCDFGSAKKLVSGEPNLAYICSRHYRAPELILGATNYDCMTDMWSAGCIIAEMMLGKPIFMGNSSNNQLVEIIKVLGNLSSDDIQEINPKYSASKFPDLRKISWIRVFGDYYNEQACDLIDKILVYSPSKRITPLLALQHPFFDDIKMENARLPNGSVMPELFNWNSDEVNAGVHEVLTPAWAFGRFANEAK